ncbi:MAG: Ig-like domain repeat protein [Candidatus Competibacter sp.]|nr:Ig-like domain repeat protein [Candidatus Competibacter sp.]HRD50823.1 Ig-like domain repeat protein [Candidatus Contendobacter sp.]
MLQRRCAASRLLILLAGLVFSVPLFAASIDPVNKYAWAENAGWINWRDTVNNYGSAQVFADHLEGYVWAENIGWIRLGSFSGGGTHPYANTTAVNYGVNRAGTNLSGYAWSEAAGWVNFAPTGGGVTIDATTGQFDGYAWSENVGWIHLRNASPAYNVAILTGGAVTLTSSLNPSTVSQSVTFTATVAGTPTPTGTVDFTADSVAITGCTANALTSGATTCTTADLSVGSHAIAAVYSGDGNYPSATGTLTQTVEAPTTVNPTGPGYGSTPAPEQTLNLGLISVGAYGTGNLLIRNTGDARLDISTLTLSGPNAGDFRVDPTSLSIHNGGPAQTLLLTCTPTATGYRTATLTVTHNATIGNPAHYPLACTGVAETAQLTVSTTGLGAVTSSPSGITCGSDCTERYAPDTIVTLTATPSRSTTFLGWSGGCAGAAAVCTVTMNTAKTVTAAFSGIAPPRTILGVLRHGQWYLDRNGNQAWDECGADSCHSFGQTGDRPMAGHWDGGSRSLIGVFRPDTAQGFLDRNGNGQWDGCVADSCYLFGQIGDLPVAGDWIGGGFAQIGVFRNGQWFLDANGNGTWDQCGADLCSSFGQLGDLPVVGDWNGDGKADVGVFRAGNWYIDANGNGAWDDCGIDRCILKDASQPSAGFGQHGDLPVIGDWTGDGVVKMGVFRAESGSWHFDANGNGAWDGCEIDRCHFASFGQREDLPIVGRW